MTPNYSDLKYFVEIALNKSLSQAALRLGISQPSLSVAIQRLETAVGTQLLMRSKKGVALTPSGRSLLSKAHLLIQTWDETHQKVSSTHANVHGNFVIGCHPSVALYTLPGFLPKFLRQHPDVEFTLVHELSRKILEEVVSVRIDLGIVVNPYRHPDLVIQKICQDEVTFFNSKSGLKSEDVLICDPSLTQTQNLLKKCRQRAAGLKPLIKRIIHSSNLELIAELTAKGAGLGILPSRVATRLGSQLEKAKGFPSYKDEIAVVYRYENKTVKTIQLLTEQIKKSLELV